MLDPENIPDSALKRLGSELTELLDDDQWNNIEHRYLLPALEELEKTKLDFQNACDVGRRLESRIAELEEQIRMREEALSEQTKDYAEWMPPEDYTQLSRRVDDLSALVRLLVHNIRKFNIDNVPATRAMDYLKRHRFSGNILRSDEPQPKEIPDSGGHIESADCWCGPTVEEHPGGRLVIHNQTH